MLNICRLGLRGEGLIQPRQPGNPGPKPGSDKIESKKKDFGLGFLGWLGWSSRFGPKYSALINKQLYLGDY